jgi:maltose-binding protein MalE
VLVLVLVLLVIILALVLVVVRFSGGTREEPPLIPTIKAITTTTTTTTSTSTSTSTRRRRIETLNRYSASTLTVWETRLQGSPSVNDFTGAE